jgi:hypothetical protein
MSIDEPRCKGCAIVWTCFLEDTVGFFNLILELKLIREEKAD